MIGYTKTSSEKVFLKKLVLFHALETQLYNIFNDDMSYSDLSEKKK